MRIKSNTPLIFVVEDEPAIVELITTLLESAGYRTRHAVNGWTAWDGIRESCPDGVIMDINIGGMDGLAVLRTMRKHPQTRTTPVLMLTARGGPEDVAEAIGLGARDYLTKPFVSRMLLARVARLVAHRRGAPVEQEPEPDTSLHI